MKIPFLFFLFASISISGNAQELLSGSHKYSHKKTAYITKKDGTEIVGKINKVKRSKGLLESVALTPEGGKKTTLLPDEIAFMYLPPSGLDKLNKAVKEATTMGKWDRPDIEADLIKEGYVYFERAPVIIKKKEKILLMQLLNPSFSSKLKVYYDPLAKETTGIGVGGITVAGGLEKSYYILRADDPAYKMKKKDYKKDFEAFYKDCPDIYNEFGEKPDWPDFAKHIHYYSTKCQ